MKEHWRIIRAITAKDLVEGLRNKHTIALVISALFVVILYRFLPALTNDDEHIYVRIYDAGESSLVAMLENSAVLKPHTYQSRTEMERRLADESTPDLGLVIPEDYDDVLSDGNTPELTGYVMHWVGDAEARELQQIVEGEIAALSGVAVPIHVAEQRVYSWPDSTGNGLMPAIGMVFIVLMVGMMLPTHLMIEERQVKTLDALLVSPASAAHVVVGKAITGMCYALLGVSVAFIMNHALINQWWLAVLAAGCGALFSAALGLLLGSTMQTRQQLSLWAWVLIGPLFIPMFLSIMEDLVPAWLITVFRAIPTVALFNVFRASFAGEIALLDWAPRLAIVLGYTGLVLAIVVWIVRRSDR